MGTALELVYQYRQLTGKCESGAGLDLDEIEVLGTIEALFDTDRVDEPADGGADRREFVREPVDLRACIRGRRHADPVRIVDLGPGGLVCRDAPFVETGERLEILIDDPELCLSYRFIGVVSWLRETDSGCIFGIRFVGMPLLVRYGPPSAVDDDSLDLAAA